MLLMLIDWIMRDDGFVGEFAVNGAVLSVVYTGQRSGRTMILTTNLNIIGEHREIACRRACSSLNTRDWTLALTPFLSICHLYEVGPGVVTPSQMPSGSTSHRGNSKRGNYPHQITLSVRTYTKAPVQGVYVPAASVRKGCVSLC